MHIGFGVPLTLVGLSFCVAFWQVWRGVLHRRKRDGPKILITDSELHVEGFEQPLPLSEEERELLGLFLQHRGAVFTPETILSRLWWPDRPYTPEFIDTTAAALNALLQTAGFPEGMIESFQGVGYRMKPASEIG